MEAPPLEPIVPLQPIAPPPPTPQETIDVLGNQDLMALVTGKFSQAESRRLQRVSTQVRDAVQGARQQELGGIFFEEHFIVAIVTKKSVSGRFPFNVWAYQAFHI